MMKMPTDDPDYDKDLRKLAVQEINKVQLRHVDTNVKHDIGDLVVNIINYKDQAIPENQEVPIVEEPVEGEIVDDEIVEGDEVK